MAGQNYKQWFFINWMLIESESGISNKYVKKMLILSDCLSYVWIDNILDIKKRLLISKIQSSFYSWFKLWTLFFLKNYLCIEMWGFFLVEFENNLLHQIALFSAKLVTQLAYLLWMRFFFSLLLFLLFLNFWPFQALSLKERETTKEA